MAASAPADIPGLGPSTSSVAVAARICFVFNAANYAKFTNPEPLEIPAGPEDSAREKALLCCFPAVLLQDPGARRADLLPRGGPEEPGDAFLLPPVSRLHFLKA